MKGFNMITLEINADCNRNCVFCPNGNPEYKKRRGKSRLDMKLIEKILKELQEMNFKGKIDLALFNEPLLDKRIYKIGNLIYEYLPKNMVCMFSNGDLIKSAKDIEKLLDAHINKINLNGYTHERYLFLKKIVDEVHETTKHQLATRSNHHVGIKLKNKECHISIVDKSIPWQQLTKEHKIENRCNLLDIKDKVVEPLDKYCARPFRSLCINSLGKAVLCCNDFFGDVIVGDVSKNTIQEIWEGKALHNYRKKLIMKDRNIELCDVCDFSGGVHLYSLKTAWKELL